MCLLPTSGAPDPEKLDWPHEGHDGQKHGQGCERRLAGLVNEEMEHQDDRHQHGQDCRDPGETGGKAVEPPRRFVG